MKKKFTHKTDKKINKEYDIDIIASILVSLKLGTKYIHPSKYLKKSKIKPKLIYNSKYNNDNIWLSYLNYLKSYELKKKNNSLIISSNKELNIKKKDKRYKNIYY